MEDVIDLPDDFTAWHNAADFICGTSGCTLELGSVTRFATVPIGVLEQDRKFIIDRVSFTYSYSFSNQWRLAYCHLYPSLACYGGDIHIYHHPNFHQKKLIIKLSSPNACSFPVSLLLSTVASNKPNLPTPPCMSIHSQTPSWCVLGNIYIEPR